MSLTFPQECSFSWKKIIFLLLANTGVGPPFFKITRFKLQKFLKACWPSETESNVRWVICWKEKTLVGLPHIVKAVSETWSNPQAKVNSTHAWSFQRESCYKKHIMPNVNFVLCSNNKDELRDLYDYLNQKVITAINNGISSNHQTDYMSSQCSFQLKLLKTTNNILQGKVG